MSEVHQTVDAQQHCASESEMTPAAAPTSRLSRILFHHPGGRYLPFLALFAFSAFFRFGLYAHNMWNDDIPSYIFAADTFALGRLKVPVPAPDNRRTFKSIEFFRTWMVVPHSFDDRDADGKPYRHMYSRYSPGHPLVLYLGKMVLGAYQYVPLVLVMLCAIGVFLILRLLYNETAARIGVWLMALSPFFLAYACSLLSHNTTFLCVVFGTLFYILQERADTFRAKCAWGAVCSFSYAAAVTCRPMTGACFVLAVIIWEVLHARINRKGLPVRWLSMFLGGLIPIAGLLWYNAQLTGKPMRFPFIQYWPRDTLGFTGLHMKDISRWSPMEKKEQIQEFKGEEAIGTLRRRYLQHTPYNGLFHIGVILNRFNDTFLIFPSSLMLLVILLIRYRSSLPRWWLFFVLQVTTIFFGQFFYFAEGSLFWGPRYYFECLLPAIALLAPLLPLAWKTLSSQISLRPVPIALLCLLVSVVHSVSVWEGDWQLQERKQKERRIVLKNIRRTVRPPAIVFMEPQYRDMGRYVGHFHGHLLNDPLHQGPILYAINNEMMNSVLIKEYPDRNVYEMKRNYIIVPRKKEDYAIIVPGKKSPSE